MSGIGQWGGLEGTPKKVIHPPLIVMVKVIVGKLTDEQIQHQPVEKLIPSCFAILPVEG
ncbi:hypothetical protein PUNSTDRAFT_138714 [Punctularia strigosozonata HHB-11173 SS5]|uniref:Uncharacterized protein n=1 Tax=Punctularia strigosozonata (strain HHB-11173) TaxID=741275 RepID=R7S1Q6_PUNST|nr:uncharacterized protein PUNSTDRAFT_138714 [Punctularia strigosozonata HHB-11173 SS5]EIN04320.1 hypothetical protein PUNSTDRAFT_138714 [Punctularia strigosozonata HHB-11173 SS5]